MENNMNSINRAFPYKTDINGIRPSGDIKNIDNAVAEFYDRWKADFVVESITYKGAYYISTGGGTNVKADTITVSEGHGYGMITVALMAGYDDDAKDIFDGMFSFFDTHRSVINAKLPSWQVRGEVGKYETEETFPSATDGDFDVAYALLLADKQWGSTGSINYLEEAKSVIEGIWESDIRHDNHRILLGDWVKGEEVDEKYENSTRPSDWMPAHFREYSVAVPNHNWNKVIYRIYS
jgi:endo-1,4-beta-D-glucanase Y